MQRMRPAGLTAPGVSNGHVRQWMEELCPPGVGAIQHWTSHLLQLPRRLGQYRGNLLFTGVCNCASLFWNFPLQMLFVIIQSNISALCLYLGGTETALYFTAKDLQREKILQYTAIKTSWVSARKVVKPAYHPKA